MWVQTALSLIKQASNLQLMDQITAQPRRARSSSTTSSGNLMIRTITIVLLLTLTVFWLPNDRVTLSRRTADPHNLLWLQTAMTYRITLEVIRFKTMAVTLCSKTHQSTLSVMLICRQAKWRLPQRQTSSCGCHSTQVMQPLEVKSKSNRKRTSSSSRACFARVLVVP